MNQAIYDVKSLIAAVEQGFQPHYLFFWGHQPQQSGQIGKECLSQWWPAIFTIEGVSYPTAEHYMMAEKARLFGDIQTCQAILAASQPSVAKRLGREVRGFDEALWSQQRFEIVVRGNKAKFSQNETLKAFLLNTQARVLVEASPVDPVWGIGLAEASPEAADPTRWRGLNLLGFALMKVRARLTDL